MITYEVRVDDNGTKEWRLNDKRHREDGPALEYANGTKSWWLNGELHREDGPAVEWSDGTKSWFLNGKRHRGGGPAIEGANGYKEWWLNGVELTEEEWRKKVSPVQELTVAEIEELLGHKVKVIKG